MRGRKPSKIHPTAASLTTPPRAPAWLPKVAAEEWRKAARTLVDRGTLTEGDLGALAGYASAFGDFVMTTRQIEADGLVLNGKKHPLLTAQVAARNQLRQFAAELGLTPAARSKAPQGKSDDDDSLVD